MNAFNESMLKIAEQMALQGTCLRRNYGAVITNAKEIVSTGYSNVPKHCRPCSEVGCKRTQLNIPSGERYELCRSVHAEQHALIHANPYLLKGSTLFLVGVDSNKKLLEKPFVCDICKKLLVDAGVSKVIILPASLRPIYEDVDTYVSQI